MAKSSLLDSFDPFATHPFTNNSGLVPQPPEPSRYPVPIPSSTRRSYFPPQASSVTPSPSPMKSPQARAPSSPSQPVFVPFRKETSSPDLVLKKKIGTKSMIQA